MNALSRADLRRVIAARAHNCCENCRISQSDALYRFHSEHIISKRHRGTDTLDNLCLSCQHSNAHKGTDLGGIDETTGTFAFLFHPRRDDWDAHFKLNGAIIEGVTANGRVTVFLLNMNSMAQIARRIGLSALGRYPC
jgi:hypothetical protein